MRLRSRPAIVDWRIAPRPAPATCRDAASGRRQPLLNDQWALLPFACTHLVVFRGLRGKV